MEYFLLAPKVPTLKIYNNYVCDAQVVIITMIFSRVARNNRKRQATNKSVRVAITKPKEKEKECEKERPKSGKTSPEKSPRDHEKDAINTTSTTTTVTSIPPLISMASMPTTTTSPSPKKTISSTPTQRSPQKNGDKSPHKTHRKEKSQNHEEKQALTLTPDKTKPKFSAPSSTTTSPSNFSIGPAAIQRKFSQPLKSVGKLEVPNHHRHARSKSGSAAELTATMSDDDDDAITLMTERKVRHAHSFNVKLDSSSGYHPDKQNCVLS